MPPMHPRDYQEFYDRFADLGRDLLALAHGISANWGHEWNDRMVSSVHKPLMDMREAMQREWNKRRGI